MNFISVCVALFMCIVMVSGQFFGNGFGRDFGYNGYSGYNGRYNAFNGDLGGPTAFSGSLGVDMTNVRDPRQNRGPVVFPPPPQDGPIESSGVIVGASGFGFVPPTGQQDHNAGRQLYRKPLTDRANIDHVRKLPIFHKREHDLFREPELGGYVVNLNY